MKFRSAIARRIVTVALLWAGILAAQTATGFKVGDTVQINTGFGWINGTVLKINGDRYFVHAQSGGDVWKTYPAELRRVGATAAENRARGIYQLHDRVQVNVQGRWMDGEITTTMGQDYQVTFPGNRTAWTTAQDMRIAPGSEKPARPANTAAGQAPRPGAVSCAGKIEGRYSNTGGFGNMTIIFRSGKALLADPGGGGEEMECWMSGGKIYLHKAGASPNTDMPLEINQDGTLDTPFGEIKKKGN